MTENSSEKDKKPEVVITQFRLDLDQFEKDVARAIALMEEFENKLKSLSRTVTFSIRVDEQLPPIDSSKSE
jgi:hypothetical protein